MAGLVTAATGAASVLLAVAARGTGGLFNDFYAYWGGASVLAHGASPYDAAAVAAALRLAGVHATVGQFGYSYPVIFAFLNRPLTALPPWPAALAFTTLSLTALALATALLLTPLRHLSRLELLLLAVGAGLFAPVSGSLYFGQANLLVLLLLALAFRSRWRVMALAVASAIKLYPGVGLAALAARGRRDAASLAAGIAISLGLIVLPNLAAPAPGLGSQLALQLGPDTFWSNQSINGALSRLALPAPYTTPPLPGLPVTATAIALTVLLGAASTALLLRLRGRPWDGCLALLLAYASVAAPKNSLWNFTPLLLAMAFCWPRVRRRPAPLAVLLAGTTLIELQLLANTARETLYRGSPALTWLSSIGLYGALLIAGVLAFVLLQQPAQPLDGGVQTRQTLIPPQ